MDAFRCFIVDKEPAFHRITEQVIRYDQLPIKASYFLSPIALIEQLDRLSRKDFPDFIFADYHSYVYDGKKLAHKLVNRYDGLKMNTRYVITISSKFEENYIGLKENDPVDMVLVKPFSKHSFLTAINHCLG